MLERQGIFSGESVANARNTNKLELDMIAEEGKNNNSNNNENEKEKETGREIYHR